MLLLQTAHKKEVEDEALRPEVVALEGEVVVTILVKTKGER